MKNLFKKLTLAASILFAVFLWTDLQSQTIDEKESEDCAPGQLANLYCPYWNISVSFTFTGPRITCSTGGQFKCKEEK